MLQRYFIPFSCVAYQISQGERQDVNSARFFAVSFFNCKVLLYISIFSEKQNIPIPVSFALSPFPEKVVRPSYGWRLHVHPRETPTDIHDMVWIEMLRITNLDKHSGLKHGNSSNNIIT